MLFLRLLAVFAYFSVFFLVCIYHVWRLYLLGHGEHGTAVVDEIVKGKKDCRAITQSIGGGCIRHTCTLHIRESLSGKK